MTNSINKAIITTHNTNTIPTFSHYLLHNRVFSAFVQHCTPNDGMIPLLYEIPRCQFISSHHTYGRKSCCMNIITLAIKLNTLKPSLKHLKTRIGFLIIDVVNNWAGTIAVQLKKNEIFIHPHFFPAFCELYFYQLLTFDDCKSRNNILGFCFTRAKSSMCSLLFYV
jgi:hypothetical protein